MILKLVGLHGLLYSEEEADELKSSTASVAASEAASQGREEQPQGVEPTAKLKPARGKAKGAQGGADELKRKIDKAGSINAVTDLMLLPETQKSLNEIPVAVRDKIAITQRPAWWRSAGQQNRPLDSNSMCDRSG